MRAIPDIVPLSALSADELAIWRRLQADDPDLGSPYLSPDYHLAVEAVRPGVEVVRWTMGGESVGFLPFRPNRLGAARAPGGPVEDVQGIVCARDVTLDLDHPRLRRRLGGLAFAAVPYTQARHGLGGQEGDGNHVIDLSNGFAAWRDERLASGSSARRELKKSAKLLAREDVFVRHGVTDAEILDRLIALKREAYDRSGYFDIFTLDWTKALLETLLASDAEGARGFISTLEIGGEVAAISYALRGSDVLHYWFPAYEDAHAKLKPGLALLTAQAEWAADQGLLEFHLGLGDVQYKRQFGSWMMPVRCGSLALSPLSRMARAAADASFAMEGRSRLADIPAKAARKWERVALAGTLKA